MNDTSNAIRFNSNLYAIEQISKDPLLIFRGYDIDIRRVMNIGNPFGDKDTLLASASLHGYRVVQPHHAVINLLLKHGVLYTIFYFAVFSKLEKSPNQRVVRRRVVSRKGAFI